MGEGERCPKCGGATAGDGRIYETALRDVVEEVRKFKEWADKSKVLIYAAEPMFAALSDFDRQEATRD